ncbi:MAG TPA: ATP-binding protein [Myxococcota bacterium]|nr:ATP-binding protein [Myxococcota bacterium]HON24446.1 ATP-binding protein [Myxococcota bacterium]HOS61108.1 ATP-binding protein [Myxococcota bacterium]HPC90750.1 ATP-binding protein [Myxococcota bacterium]HPL24202.1 ATP-binding protein [Myxococcota bacterium]
MRYIERTTYLNRLKGLRNTPDIKIITGIRRSGKSELMRAYINYLRDTDDKANVIYVDYFDLKYENLKDYSALHEHIERQYQPGINNYVFVDEVQLCPSFELAINSLHNSKKYDIYLTGSNAFLLSSDLTTLFTGRFIEIPIFPFSFQEFCLYFSDERDRRKLFDDYVLMGGLAGSYEYPSNQDRIAYLRDVYKTIVNRDLVDKYRLPNTVVLNHLTEFMMDNISNLTSPNNISEKLGKASHVTNHVTIGKYIDHLCDAFMFYKVKRYDIKGKRYLETLDKYYLCDLGMRYAVLGQRNMDYGRAYENLVAIELLRRGYEVYVGKLYQKEVDFIAIKQSEKLYIQVSDNITKTSTLNSEVAPLLQIRDAYPKLLIANTGHPEYLHEGIRIIDLSRWLLDV